MPTHPQRNFIQPALCYLSFYNWMLDWIFKYPGKYLYVDLGYALLTLKRWHKGISDYNWNKIYLRLNSEEKPTNIYKQCGQLGNIPIK